MLKFGKEELLFGSQAYNKECKCLIALEDSFIIKYLHWNIKDLLAATVKLHTNGSFISLFRETKDEIFFPGIKYLYHYLHKNSHAMYNRDYPTLAKP